MRLPIDWIEADLLDLITNQVQEDLNLDYKACASLDKADQKKNEVSKDVSAFANSAGGVIVYGIVENGHLPSNVDAGYNPADITREWLEQVINSKIKRRIDGIRINQIDLATTNPGRVAYVVIIPQSNQAPHMAADNRYYKRFNFQSIAMEDYEVRDVANRFNSPDLEVKINIPEGSNLANSHDPQYLQSFFITSSITNHSSTPAEYAFIRFYFDTHIKFEFQDPGKYRFESGYFTHEGNVTPAQILTIKWKTPEYLPIWNGFSLPILDNYFKVSLPSNSGRYLLAHEVHSPRMIPKTFNGAFVHDGHNLSLERY